MRKLLLLVGVLLVVHVALLFAHPSGAEKPPAGNTVDVGVVFDLGGRGDKSFNDGAYLGAERAQKELGVRVRFIEPGEGSDRESGLRLLAAEGMDLVIGVGFIFTDDLTQLAKEYPTTKFAGVDYSVATDKDGKVIPPPSNLAALKFREEQGSYLVGALAALVGKSKKVGFVGGMDSPLIQKFEAGYEAGVHQVCPDCTVLAQYAGVTPEAFRNPGKGKEIALAQYQQGANVIFHASGSTGLGVFEAARQTNKLAIGVDADQYAEAPGYVLTSMVKGVDNAVYDAIKKTKDGTFTGGIYQYGLAEQGVGYIYDKNNAKLIPPDVHARLEQLRQDIVAGRISVPSTK
ncbi:MAG: BMP family ABC transporter substrate-binding protein [Gemmatimonadetes bacterium]|nr:BMP family ABC transporter substrate-binding protein [Gemmatimonadota bacterium]